jgi:hypothetical protein
MEDIRLNPGQPNICKAFSHCPECEHLLQCAEDDSAWIGDTLEEVRMLAFASAFVSIRSCSKKDEELFLRTFWTHMVAELGECSSADMDWVKNAFKTRQQKIEEIERLFNAEADDLPFDGDMDLIREYAEKLDRFCGPIMTDEEFWNVINKANERFLMYEEE